MSYYSIENSLAFANVAELKSGGKCKRTPSQEDKDIIGLMNDEGTIIATMTRKADRKNLCYDVVDNNARLQATNLNELMDVATAMLSLDNQQIPDRVLGYTKSFIS